MTIQTGQDDDPPRTPRAMWLDNPGPMRLSSGLSVLVGEREDDWITVELDRGVQVTFDDEDVATDGYLAMLAWVHPAFRGPPATRPYGWDAAVRYNERTGKLTIVRVPQTPHSLDCECDTNRSAAFAGWLPGPLLVPVLEVFSRMPVDPVHWQMPSEGAAMWRGLVDAGRRAQVEHLLPDEFGWGNGPLPIAAVLDLGL